jgi:formate dehydrogenase alpha subunit
MDYLAGANLNIDRRHNTDLLKAMLAYIISHGLVNHDFIDARTTGFSNFAREIEKSPPEEIAGALCIEPPAIIKATELYLRARRPVIIVDCDTITPAELHLLSALALVTGNIGRDSAGIIALRARGNSQGLVDMGVAPDYLFGQQPITDLPAKQKLEAAWGRPITLKKGRDAQGIVRGIETGDIKGVLVVGGQATAQTCNAIFEAPIFSVLIDIAPQQKPPYPHVILPGAIFGAADSVPASGRITPRRQAELGDHLGPGHRSGIQHELSVGFKHPERNRRTWLFC